MRKVPIALIGSIAAIAALALAAGPAAATTVTPAATNFTASAEDTIFVPSNGTAMIGITCATSQATGTTPGSTVPGYAFNSADGQDPKRPASVIAPLHSLDFDEPCEAAPVGIGVDVIEGLSGVGYSIDASGEHTLSASLEGHGDDGTVAIAVPGEDIRVDLEAPADCSIFVPSQPDGEGGHEPVAAAIMGSWTNGDPTDDDPPSKLDVREQVQFVGEADTLCEQDSQAVFYADGTTKLGVTTDDYDVTPAVQINTP